ncbi:MAG: molybdopterin-guanine dinucleotide biosynthesis protein B [Verrucomicrobia bacterium]|jgi:molybdopterin-guanine dinucleotide biosynthesis protein MobB|nr:molybdopterin-guanine dinucleotide biosynthesis protein B [Verrucomicrobiota bacterium]MBT7069224.1 molybdopterin-guanine dinucleotide biosynthesis protein B [Verrucomicrobiota bacterium]MBT7702337.1 molybdopterin-guanine dinucleotide biosynthesis protein B [Verrucomicrobiota bacterium]
MMDHYPIFCISGYSGAGKTTVIVPVIEALCARGLKVGIIKHDVHGLNIDCEGKDTDRFFKAGADVFIRGPEQAFFRAHRRGDISLDTLLRRLGPHYDIIIAEGHKTTPLPYKVWLCGEDDAPPPPETTGIQRVLKRDEDRVRIVLEMIDAWLPDAWQKAPVYAGILIGGGSTRFGKPKHLQTSGGQTWLERAIETVKPHVDGIALLGAGDLPASAQSLPVLCDIPGRRGPLAGILAATRWMPQASWLFIPCDLPLLTGDAVRWILDQRRPGVWAVLPQLTDAPAPEPLLAYYDFRSFAQLECMRRPVDMASADNVSSPVVPQGLQASWTNVNTAEDLAAANTRGGGVCR